MKLNVKGSGINVKITPRKVSTVTLKGFSYLLNSKILITQVMIRLEVIQR